jgi:hypothetical protein
MQRAKRSLCETLDIDLPELRLVASIPGKRSGLAVLVPGQACLVLHQILVADRPV